MEDQSIPQQPIPSQKKKEGLIFLLIAIIVALLSGFSVYFWQQSFVSSLKQKLANQQLQIQQLQKKSEEKTQTEIQPVSTSDSRILLTPEIMGEHNRPGEDCDIELNNDEPSTTITYKNQSKGLSVELPYNPYWGNDTYKISPYDEYDTSVRFGNISPFQHSEACEWTRPESIFFEATMTIEETESRLKSNPVIKQTIEKIKLSNGLTGFKYIDEGPGIPYVVEVVGDIYNYRIRLSPGSEDSNKEFAHIENIANSIKLVK